MSGRLQAGVAVLVALGLHVGAFALRPEAAGAVSSGAGGQDLVSLQAADAMIADLVEDWGRPPKPMADPLAASPPPQAFEPPPDLVAPAEMTRPSFPAAMALPQWAEAPPMADVSLPPPPPPPAAAPEPDPMDPPPPAPPKPRPKPEPPVEKPKAEPAKPQPKAERSAGKPRPSAGQAAQTAAGSGGGPQAGAGGTAQAATLSQGQRQDLKADWGAAIRARVERRKSYPSAARGASGTVTLRMAVSRSGQVGGVSVVGSSGNAVLDQAAVRAVKAAGHFPAAPRGLTEASHVFDLTMTFAR